MDPYSIQVNQCKRLKIINANNTNDINIYSIVCPICSDHRIVNYSAFKKHVDSKKHRIGLTIWYNQNTSSCDEENILEIG